MIGKNGSSKEEIKYLLLNESYLLSLDKMGFSKEFLLREQVKRQKECIEYLAQKIDELNKEMLAIRKEIDKKDIRTPDDLVLSAC
jgi:hypothetical protein